MASYGRCALGCVNLSWVKRGAFRRQVLSEGDDPGRTRQLIASVIVIAVLIAAGLWLTGALRRTNAIQDCVASGRTNCAPMR